MILDYNTVKSITKGAARVADNDGFEFYRFSKPQENIYRKYHSALLYKTYATSGVALEFVTDSSNLYIDTDFAKGSSRSYYAFDILCDGKKIDSITNYTDDDSLPAGREYSLDNVKKNIALGEGIKTVKIVLPWTVAPKINEIRIDDNSVIKPTAKKEKMIFFGDSITQGYDAAHPTETYAYQLAERLGVEAYNKAIGGECFFPELLEPKEDFEPKYIAVAYGTNDWNIHTQAKFEADCKLFYKRLVTAYPDAKIFAITPIWRKDNAEERPMGDFEGVAKYIFEVAAEHKNIIPISGYDFVPHDEKYYADMRIHPNSEGFGHYADNLFSCIKSLV